MRRIALIWIYLLLVSGCASALKEPPTLSELAGARDEHDENASAERIDAWQANARELYDLREPDAVARSAKLSLRVANADPSRLEAFVLATRAWVWLADHESGDARVASALKAVQSGQWCRRTFPDEPECAYWLALALGVQAREKRTTALDGLDIMVELLEEVIASRPELDHGGPHRVLALVLLRAPGWPSGPGDPDRGLEEAGIAVRLAPEYPPNLLALAEALAETEAAEPSREAYREAERMAQKRLESGESEALEWLEAARSELSGRRDE